METKKWPKAADSPLLCMYSKNKQDNDILRKNANKNYRVSPVFL